MSFSSRRRRWSAEIRESFHMALEAIAAHKLRSSLTLLGVVVGVFSIILVMTIMRALQHGIESEMSSLGTQTFVVQKMPAFPVGGPETWEKLWRRPDLRFPLVAQLRARASSARSVGAQSFLWNGQALSRLEKSNPDVPLIGVTAEMFAARNWNVAQGRALLDTDLDSARQVCVLGSGLARKLFPYGAPLLEDVKYQGIRYKIVGVLAERGGIFGGDQDNFILIPLTAGLNRYGSQRSLELFVQSWDQAGYDDTVEQVRGALRALRKVLPGQPDDFEIVSSESLIRQFRSFTLAARAGVAVVSSIALLAAGVGIMNIMLVSVTERTGEIGIRRAVGAKRRNILTQFVLEAIVLCQLGGVVGVILGVGLGNLATLYLDVPPMIPLDWVALGLLLCTLVGLVFGTYPALKAARVDPIQSLRFE
ncbi:MAG TPA: ABC transporter permease [Candidatus Paceibacterota bacterium]|nr:ABC transporter permease [Verrucomicrobiota bacterium]HOX01013.1 ABC transporter permease [Verrucomicrobiota bacterium]HRZ43883.1 ABC transporter permease [Candidatus Paceibacterota bacterium]HRZ94662.1 ABC transporter permease [Candidatus Paceibacterota bacterium]